MPLEGVLDYEVYACAKYTGVRFLSCSESRTFVEWACIAAIATKVVSLDSLSFFNINR